MGLLKGLTHSGAVPRRSTDPPSEVFTTDENAVAGMMMVPFVPVVIGAEGGRGCAYLAISASILLAVVLTGIVRFIGVVSLATILPL